MSLLADALQGYYTPEEIKVYIAKHGEMPPPKLMPSDVCEPLGDRLCVTEEQARADREFLETNSYDGPVL